MSFQLGELGDFGNALREVLGLAPLYGDAATLEQSRTDEDRFGRRVLFTAKPQRRPDGPDSGFSW